MTEPAKTSLRIAALLAIGLAPAITAFILAPSRGVAVAAAGSAAMAVGFVVWTQRLVADEHLLRLRETALRSDLVALEESVSAQARELREVRSRDATTGALNRAGLLQRLDETVGRDGRLGKSVAFLLVDIEGFKAINIERGRLGGDATLKRVAHVLADATRGTDCVGRLGGDEFGVVLHECDDPGPAVNRVFRALQGGSPSDSVPIVHVSIGAVTIEDPSAGVDVQELFRLAEGALSSVRGTGGSLCARRTLRPRVSREATSA
jgi:diguanylate cyclase (GGDEF)-like protein